MRTLPLVVALVAACDIAPELPDAIGAIQPASVPATLEPAPVWSSGPPPAGSCAFDLSTDHWAKSLPLDIRRDGGGWSIGYSPVLVGPSVDFVDAACYDWTDAAPLAVTWTPDEIAWLDHGWSWRLEPTATDGVWAGELVDGCGRVWDASLVRVGCD